MGVSATGSRMSMASIRAMLVAFGVAASLGFYMYGPPVTRVMHSAAVSSCNELAGGNYRSYHLEWTVLPRPHWRCWNLSEPAEPPADLGWWVTPG